MDITEKYISFCLSVLGNNVTDQSFLEDRYSFLLSLLREGMMKSDVGQASISANNLYEIVQSSTITPFQSLTLYKLRLQLFGELLR